MGGKGQAHDRNRPALMVSLMKLLATSAALRRAAIGAHAYPWRVYDWQKHLFTAFMLFRARFAQPACAFVDTLSAYIRGGFAAYIAGDSRSFISGKYLDGR